MTTRTLCAWIAPIVLASCTSPVVVKNDAGAPNPCAGVVCAVMDQCHVAGTCDPTTGKCSNPNATDGTTCDDMDACTQTDQCMAGVCTGTDPVTCTAMDQCHVAGTCDPTSGTCSNPNATDGTTCSDMNACTQTDACMAGVCTGTDPVTCTAMDQCHAVGTCDPTSGQCSNPNATDGTKCNDMNACTQTDQCMAGVCTGTDPVTCTAMDQCHTAGTCDPTSGKCSNPNATDGTACACGACGSGVCGAQTLGVTCDNGTRCFPVALAVDSTSVYYVNSADGFSGDGEVASLPKVTGGTPTVLDKGYTNLQSVVVSGGDLFYGAANSGLFEDPITGGMGTRISTDPQAALATDGTNLYWSNPTAGTIVSMPIGGSTETPIVTGQGTADFMATDGVNVYWTSETNQTVVQAKIDGGSVVTLASGLETPLGIAVDAKNVYFTDEAAGTVNMVPIGGSAVTTLAAGQAQPYSIVVLNSVVYWGNYNRGEPTSIMKVAVSGGAVGTVAGADNEIAPVAMTTDGQCLYWVLGDEASQARRAPP